MTIIKAALRDVAERDKIEAPQEVRLRRGF